jgi:hypothetical protein
MSGDSSMSDPAGFGTKGTIVYDLTMKALGPTADVVGKRLASYTGKALDCVERVLTNAVKKLGDRSPSHGVPLRVAKSLVLEAPFCDDALAAEYFGGVLASSRSGVDRDDRGVEFLAQLSSMSVYQIRAHYIFYQSAKRLLEGKIEDPRKTGFMKGSTVAFRKDSFFKAMEFTGDEVPNASVIMDQALAGMERDELIGSAWGLVGTWRNTGIAVSSEESRQFWVAVPILDSGIDLFMWAYGHGNLPLQEFFSTSVKCEAIPHVELPMDAEKLKTPWDR